MSSMQKDLLLISSQRIVLRLLFLFQNNIMPSKVVLFNNLAMG